MIALEMNGRPAEGSSPFASEPRAATRVWMSVDLGALALAVDGARPFPAGSAHLMQWRADVAAPHRVPASAFVSVRRRVAEKPATEIAEPRGEATLAEPAAATPVRNVHPLRRNRATAASVAPSRMPRRHKLMLAAAAVVMSLGFLGAGTQRPVHPADAATAALVSLAG